MPSSPRKPVKNEVMLRGIHTRRNSDDGDDSDDLPSLVSCSADEDSDEDDDPKKTTSKTKVKGKETVKAKPKTNGECVDMWYKLSKADKDKNIHVMKIYLLSPFLFHQVNQDDKWIKWAFECGLLPSKSSFEIRSVKEEYLDAVDLVESAFTKLADSVLWKNKDGLLKTLETITKVNMSQHLDKAITCAESFLSFTTVRDMLRLKSGMNKKQGDIALLFAQNQVSDHIKQLAAGKNLVEDYGRSCKDEEDQSAENKKKGNDDFSNGRYAAAISKYSRALDVSPYNHVLYGNRAQSFLKTNKFWRALADGRRATVLKADWHKAQYRYAQAFFELGFYDKAIDVNRAARKICSEKKDLDSQHHKFIKSMQTASNSRGKVTGKRTSHTGAVGRKSSIGSDNEDLPELVEAESSDTSRSDDERLGEDKMPGLVELESQEETDDSCNSDGEGVPLHQSESSHESDSDDLASRSRTRRTVAYLEHKKKRQDKARNNLHERQGQDKEMKKQKSKLTAKTKEQKKIGKRARNNQVTQKELSVELQRKRELNDWLTQGTKALQEKKSVTAVRSYGEALKIVEQYSYQLLEMKEIDFVILLYSHGTACLHTGTHEELQVAMKQFQIIILQYKHIDFPLAYHGEGSVLYKQNRFTEALIPLEKGLVLVKRLGDELGTYRWPASQVIIDESKPGKLLNTFETLIRICKHPPRPDAICRYSDCTSKTQVYLTDPDYKGFIRLICHENCKVEYHPVCWKKLKNSDSGKAGDKDFIEDKCMTPDCCGLVINIQIFDAEGLKTEFNSEKANPKLESKTKPTKQPKVKLSVASAKQRKKKGKEVLKVDQPVSAEVTSTDSNEEKQQAAYHLHVNNTPFYTVHREEKPSEGGNTLAEMQRGYDPFSSDVGIRPADDGVYILKKESDEDPAKGSVVKGFSKAKSRKKKIKNTQTLDEFLKDHGGHSLPLRSTIDSVDDIDEIPPPQCAFDLVAPPPGWSQHEMEAPFAVPPHLQDQAADFEASYRAMNMFPSSSSFSLSEQRNVKNVTEYVSTLLLEILHREGALDLADPKILEPLSILEDECQEIISQAGGLRPILEQSRKFVFQGNKVMLPEEKEFIKDMLQTLRPFSKGSSKETKNPFLERTINGLDTDTIMDHSVKLQKDVSKTGIAGGESIWDLDGVCRTNGVDIDSSHLTCSSSSSLLCTPSISPRFNPDAKEFVPTLSNTSSNTSITTVIENTCGDIESVDDQIVEQVSNVQPDTDPRNTNDLSLVTGVYHDIEPVFTGPTCKSETSLALGSRNNDKSSETLSNVHGELTSFVVSGGKNALLVVKDDLMQAENLQKPNSGGEQVTNSKTKAVQTQPNVKTKGVGTDSIPEPFKAEYHRAVAEKDALQNKLQEATDRHAAMRNKNTAECDKLKKRLTEALQEKEKYLKEALDIKQKNLEEIRMLRQQCEDKDEKMKTLSQKLHDAEEKSSTVSSLKKELMSYKAQLAAEKELWMKERSEKDDLLKNVQLQQQHQHTRAQEAEVKLLELRRDVGLRFLERAYQESHITINNLIQALKARIAGPKVEELVNTWKSYASECHQRVMQCKTTFNEQIELLKGGCTLASVPQLPIPGPPPYPAIPVLQSVVPGQQPQSHPPKESSSANRTSAAATVVAAAAAAPSAAAAVSSAGAPSMVVPPSGSNGSLNGESLTGSGSAAAADKGRTFNSFEKIMLRLSAMYPNFSRLELTGFIKEVRHNKHGSLTGLSLEDIVASVSELVEQKRKAGLLRTNSSTTTQRYKPTAAQPQTQQTHGMKAQTEGLKMCLGHYEEDLCVICHEDMNTSTDLVTLDCTHRYHSPCIRKWLLGEQSTCPTCREHALLPDEFPRLK